ncbi:hypothetical protein [Azospirillum argentinense]|uniref:hypothetical protein n=1 Tax=Azospirillum argentinense TaxID=2970906 RepID=UPI0032DECFE2
MADDRKKAAKSETLTIRLDQKTRFMLEFMARLRGQSLTTVVERAIVDAADNATIGSYNEPENWRDFWHVSEGVRAIKLASDSRLYPTYDEEFLVDFVNKHSPFFYSNFSYRGFDSGYVDIIWPRINEFISIWKNTKTTDYFAAGKAMQAAIRAAGVKPPDWPSSPPQQNDPSTSTNDLNDEIPF